MLRAFAVVLLIGCSPSPASIDAGARAVCPDGGGWVRRAPLANGPRQETAVAALSGEVWVIGGFDDSLSYVDEVEIYSPAANAWRLGPALPKPGHHVNVAVLDGKLYALGGLQAASFSAFGDGWVFADGAWKAVAAMPAGTERGAAAVGAVGGKIILAGGYRMGSVRDVSAYDPATDAWSALPPLPGPARDHLVGAVFGDTFFAIGGRVNGVIDGRVDALVSGAWVSKAPMRTPRAGMGAAVRGSELVVLGGEGATNADGVFPEAEVYDLMADAWRAEDDVPTPRHGTGAAALDGVVFFPAGATRASFAATAIHEALCPR